MTKLQALNRRMLTVEKTGPLTMDEYITYRDLLEFVEATKEVLRISDRNHKAWDRAKAALANLESQS